MKWLPSCFPPQGCFSFCWIPYAPGMVLNSPHLNCGWTLTSSLLVLAPDPRLVLRNAPHLSSSGLPAPPLPGRVSLTWNHGLPSLKKKNKPKTREEVLPLRSRWLTLAGPADPFPLSRNRIPEGWSYGLYACVFRPKRQRQYKRPGVPIARCWDGREETGSHWKPWIIFPDSSCQMAIICF